MQLILMWRRDPARANDPDLLSATAGRLQERFSPLFSANPTAILRQNDILSTVYLELPTKGWTGPYFQEDATRCVFSLDQVFNASRLLRIRGVRHDDANRLLRFAEVLENDAARLMLEMSPHVSILDLRKDTDEANVYHDGLGFQQLFIYDDGRNWAASNRIFAFRALGLSLEPESDPWIVRAVTGSFPGTESGFRHIRYLDPGARLTILPDGIRHTFCGAVKEWVRCPKLDPASCLEMAWEGLNQAIEDATPDMTLHKAGLTSGHDSRVVVSLMLSRGLPVRTRTRGRRSTYDVRVARELARTARIPHIVESRGALPPTDPEALRDNIRRALLWQAGYIEPRLHKTFLHGEQTMDGGTLNIMGALGGMLKWPMTKRHRERLADGASPEDLLVEGRLRRNDRTLKRSLLPHAEASIREYFREIRDWVDEPADALELYFLMDIQRRAGAAGHYEPPGQIFAPFLTPEIIRATFAMPIPERQGARIHTAIVARAMPAWAEIPYTNDMKRIDRKKHNKRMRKAAARPAWQQTLLARLREMARPLSHRAWTRSGRERNFNEIAYWRTVGRPLIDDALREGGFWEAIVNADRLRDPEQPRSGNMIVMLAELERMCES